MESVSAGSIPALVVEGQDTFAEEDGHTGILLLKRAQWRGLWMWEVSRLDLGKQWQILFSWAPKSLWMVTAAMKLNGTCSLEGKLG